MSCDAAMTQPCHHKPNSATAPQFAVLSELEHSCCVLARNRCGEFSRKAPLARSGGRTIVPNEIGEEPCLALKQVGPGGLPDLT